MGQAGDGGGHGVHHLDAPDRDHGEGDADLLLGVQGEVAEQALVWPCGLLAAVGRGTLILLLKQYKVNSVQSIVAVDQ